MVIWGILIFGAGIVILIYAQGLADKIFSLPGSKGIAGSLFRVLASFLIIGGITYLILFWMR